MKAIFLGKKTKWANKGKVVPSTLKKGAVNKSFLKKYVKKSPAQFKTYWKKQVFTGKGKAPKSFKTEKALIAYVAKTKGAVGYVSKKAAEGAAGVKILEVK